MRRSTPQRCGRPIAIPPFSAMNRPATSRFNPQVFVDIENYVDAKADAAVRVPSVDGEPHLSPDMLSASSSFRGKQGKMLHAEAYEAVRIPVFGWVL